MMKRRPKRRAKNWHGPEQKVLMRSARNGGSGCAAQKKRSISCKGETSKLTNQSFGADSKPRCFQRRATNLTQKRATICVGATEMFTTKKLFVTDMSAGRRITKA